MIVDFLEGDPDQPIITGRVYNAEQMPPYELPANKTQSGHQVTQLARAAAPANFNEIRFEDKKGTEQLFIHAEKNQDIEVENDETHWVGHDRTKTIDNDETTHVKHDRTETVDNNETITIHGNRTETVDKNETITIDRQPQHSHRRARARSATVDAAADAHGRHQRDDQRRRGAGDHGRRAAGDHGRRECRRSTVGANQSTRRRLGNQSTNAGKNVTSRRVGKDEARKVEGRTRHERSARTTR